MSLQAKLDRMAARLLDAADAVSQQCADDIKDRLNTPYPPASEPGESPRRRSGRLRDSIAPVAATLVADAIRAGVSAGASYAGYVDKGTPTMAARPFLLPAVERWNPVWRQAATEAVRGR